MSKAIGGACILTAALWATSLVAQVSPPPAPPDAFAGPGSPSEDIPSQVSLDVGVIAQETRLWCWAASAQMIMRFHGVDIPQCTQAAAPGAAPGCCQWPMPASCEHAGWPEFGKYGFSSKRSYGHALSWNDIRQEIGERNLPFAFSWRWPGGGGHMMVAVGYVDQPGTRVVQVNDPWEPDGRGSQYFVTYEEFVTAPGHHTHWDDFYAIAPSHP